MVHSTWLHEGPSGSWLGADDQMAYTTGKTPMKIAAVHSGNSFDVQILQIKFENYWNPTWVGVDETRWLLLFYFLQIKLVKDDRTLRSDLPDDNPKNFFYQTT